MNKKVLFFLVCLSLVAASCGGGGTQPVVLPQIIAPPAQAAIPEAKIPQQPDPLSVVIAPEAEYSLVSSMPGFSDLFPVEKVTGVLLSKGMPITLYPVTDDFFYKYEKVVTVFGLKKKVPEMVQTIELSGVELGYKNLYLAPDPDNVGGYLRYTILYHTTGLRVLSVGIYDRGNWEGGSYIPTQSYFTKDTRTDSTPIAEHTIVGEYYPNKIINDLEGSRRMMEYQLVNGPFIAGQEYSLLKILDFESRSGYVQGRTSNGSIVTGGGICIFVTDLNKVLVQMNTKMTMQWQHPSGSKYFENPFGGLDLSVGISDATIDSKNDYRWIQSTTGYFVISADVMPTEEILKDPMGDDGVSHDALEIISIKSTMDSSELQSSYDNLVAVRASYEAYREAGVSKLAPITASGSRPVALQPWSVGDDTSILINRIAPDERVSRFASELQADPFLMNLVELRDIINKMDPNSDMLIGDYLMTTEWYARVAAGMVNDPKQQKLLLDTIIHLNDNTHLIPDQTLQCIGLVVILGGMDSRFVYAGAIPAKRARHMIPDAIKDGTSSLEYMGGYRVLELNTIDDSMVYDLSVTYYNKSGHVFGVIGKKVVDGETVLLVISANQIGDGQIKIFEVDEDNFEVVFGYPAFHKNAIRK